MRLTGCPSEPGIARGDNEEQEAQAAVFIAHSKEAAHLSRVAHGIVPRGPVARKPGLCARLDAHVLHGARRRRLPFWQALRSRQGLRITMAPKVQLRALVLRLVHPLSGFCFVPVHQCPFGSYFSFPEET